jgi:hypothetical protein
MQNHPLCSVVLFLDRRSRLVGSACEGVRRMNKARNLLRREAKASGLVSLAPSRGTSMKDKTQMAY